MASAFWTLEDGRGFARRWSWMAELLELITNELKTIHGAEEFYEYLEKFVFSEEKGDEYNGYGGFIRGDENIMFNFDLRTFAPQNREFFWEATEKALNKLKTSKNDNDAGNATLLNELLEMHKSITLGKDPMLLNHLSRIKPESHEKLGPGWE